MSNQDDGQRILNAKIDRYLEDRGRMFALGFVRFVLEQGLETKAPQREGKPPETWRQAGRRLYGEKLFEATLAAEVNARREAYAQSRLPAVRGNQGKDGPEGPTASGGQNQRGEDHQLARRRGPAQPSKEPAQAVVDPRRARSVRSATDRNNE